MPDQDLHDKERSKVFKFRRIRENPNFIEILCTEDNTVLIYDIEKDQYFNEETKKLIIFDVPTDLSFNAETKESEISDVSSTEKRKIEDVEISEEKREEPIA